MSTPWIGPPCAGCSRVRRPPERLRPTIGHDLERRGHALVIPIRDSNPARRTPRGVGQLGSELNGGVAYWAHVGGFGVGALVAWLF